jgi:hypothetical protein
MGSDSKKADFPSLMRCNHKFKRIRRRSSTASMVIGDIRPKRFESRSLEIERISSHLIKLGLVTPPSAYQPEREREYL